MAPRGEARRARPLGAAAALREEIGASANLPERAAYERAADAARSALGAEEFASAWAAGRALPLDRATAEARAVGDAAAAEPAGTAPAAAHGLTPREAEVLRLLVEGRSDREIGAALFISPRTVMRHVTGILAKLGVDNRTAATNLAVRQGLV